MPFGDGTGPNGAGPATGRGAGYCRGFQSPGYANGGRGMGRGWFGRGRGWRNMFHLTGLPRWGRYSAQPPAVQVDPADEKEYLRNQAQDLKSSLDAINNRLNELDKQSD